MANITIRNLDDSVKHGLRLRAARFPLAMALPRPRPVTLPLPQRGMLRKARPPHRKRRVQHRQRPCRQIRRLRLLSPATPAARLPPRPLARKRGRKRTPPSPRPKKRPVPGPRLKKRKMPRPDRTKQIKRIKKTSALPPTKKKARPLRMKTAQARRKKKKPAGCTTPGKWSGAASTTCLRMSTAKPLP